ncbi:MAG: DegT/DnrJ/EryC1/StrS family aminotransferase [Bacteroidetes bacterium]|jgi:UDP-2-acetamido-2-deoxy-ribo-hexuluronate aminotransferase|nr:DegT/DnrJ/EryC1/StrS family aminotransferase [Bacteroidota bacterium]MBT6687152.1 DegT/DnrJ/EryC1/StrS family aminotransferase [Bacteroidota bacterium]MBT7144925.1 DegT/DnrJ/EryC1/StrS family aminotransferase [Bacteroidota bacterium]MBT7492156.1 DegT/DnrJ/EryC1/StrS family aminotransferase [Bacteroidota bacterium]
MKEIKMVDLYSQYLKIKPEVDNALESVIASTAFINGPEVKSFKANLESYLNVKHVIPCGNGTDALQISMMGLDLKPGDEVITTSFTFIATVEVIGLLGLKPILVDVDYDTFNIDPKSVEKAITKKTKAIVPVHLFGQCSDMNSIMKIAKQHNLYVIEDNAQAIGADYSFNENKKVKAGTIGDVGTTSFFPSKNLGGYGDGGAILTNNDELAEKLLSIVNHGMKVRYYHDRVGVNSRLDSLQAAILKIKLKHLDDYILARQKAASFYNNAFKNHENIITPITSSDTTHVFHQYTLKTKNVDRAKLIENLKSKGIPAMIYYPVPMHLQKAYKDERYKTGDFPVTELLSETVISLPMHTEMDNEQLNYITENFLNFIN